MSPKEKELRICDYVSSLFNRMYIRPDMDYVFTYRVVGNSLYKIKSIYSRLGVDFVDLKHLKKDLNNLSDKKILNNQNKYLRRLKDDEFELKGRRYY